MVTEVIMRRELFGHEICQKSKSEFFSATDLVRAGNTWRVANGMGLFSMNDWFNQKSTKEFISELEKQFGQVKISGRGRGIHTWVHPYLFIDMALAINPSLKIEVYGWLFDHLLRYRNDSGDSYKKMTGSIFHACTNKSEFPSMISKIAHKIQDACNVTDWNSATQEQLKKRDLIHEQIAILCDILPIDEAVRLSIAKNKGEI